MYLGVIYVLFNSIMTLLRGGNVDPLDILMQVLATLVIVLLALLSLGIQNIHLGPTLPAFLSPGVARVLVEKFGIAGINTPEQDLKILLDA